MANVELSLRGYRLDCVLVATYCLAIIIANALVTSFGQSALPYTAFFLIPFDLVVRDLLQDRWQVLSLNRLRLYMGTLILSGSLLSYITTVGSLRVATASFVAFSITGVIDAITYQRMIKFGRLFRINLATVFAALTDTLIFVIIAFDEIVYSLAFAQVATKAAGGVMWSLLLFKFFKRKVK